MMNSFNGIGRLTRDPILKEGKNGYGIYFTIAINENNDHANFIPVACYNKSVEYYAKVLKKGSQVGVSGQLTSYQSELEGKKINNYNVRAFSVNLLDPKNSDSSSKTAKKTIAELVAENNSNNNQQDSSDSSDESKGLDLPF